MKKVKEARIVRVTSLMSELLQQVVERGSPQHERLQVLIEGKIPIALARTEFIALYLEVAGGFTSEDSATIAGMYDRLARMDEAVAEAVAECNETDELFRKAMEK